MFYNRLCYPSGANAPAPAQYHRRTHPNTDADPIARKLPTNNINTFDNRVESAPMGLYSAPRFHFKVQKVVRRATTTDIVMMQ
jgi:hypothetical protein